MQHVSKDYGLYTCCNIPEIPEMDRENQSTNMQSQTALGCSFMSLFLVVGLMIAYYSNDIIIWLIVPVLLALVGLVVGLLAARLVEKNELPVEKREASTSQQVVNEMCVQCQQRISSILEGAICPSCRAAIHFKCAGTGDRTTSRSCPRCQSNSFPQKRPDISDAT